MKPASLWLVTLLFATCAAAETNSAAQRRAAADSFGNEIARAFNERDSKALNSLIDLHALALRAAQYQELGSDAEQAFVRGAESKGLQPLIATYFRALDTSKGTVKFMRVTNQIPPRSLCGSTSAHRDSTTPNMCSIPTPPGARARSTGTS